MRKLWNDDAGFIISAELVLIATILVIGLIVGLSEVQAALVAELNDVSCAIGSLNQSYYFRGFTGCKSQTLGSHFNDSIDICDDNCNSDLCASSSNTTTESTGFTVVSP